MKKTMFALLLFVGLYAYSQNVLPIKKAWIFVTINNEGDSLFIDSNPLSITNNVVKLWTRCIWSDSKDKKNPMELMQIMQYDCYNRMRKSGFFSNYQRRGKVLYKGESANKNWVPITPDTYDELVLELICKLFNQQ